MRKALLLAGSAFVAMEPVTYAAHRWVMHGSGWGIHRSHHRAGAVGCRLEANDWFPLFFAGLTVSAMAAGRDRSPRALPLGAGVTAYGAAYAFVHDVYIHQRLGRLPRIGVLEWLRAAHSLHHRFGGEPYGMLAPVIPAATRRKAASDTAPGPLAPAA
jgi:beta-carotene 3-hydroxylase